MTDQKPDKSLPGGQEKIVRAVERTLAASTRRERPGVKITNLSSGLEQVEVHAYDDDLTAAGDAARAEFDRQRHMTSVPTAELEQLRWLASIGKLHIDKDHPDENKSVHLVESKPEDFDEELFVRTHPPTPVPDLPEYKDIPAGPGHRARKSVPAEATTPTTDDLNDLLAKMREANGEVPGTEVTDV